jgi:hypothetical protein
VLRSVHVIARGQALLSSLTITESSWRFVTSAGGELSIGTPIVHVGFNVGSGALWLRDRAASAPINLTFGGVGGSASLNLVPFPANFSFSMPQMPSAGTVYKLPWAGEELSADELKGAFVQFAIAGDFGPGYGQALMFLGGSTRLAAFAALRPGAGSFLQLAAVLATSNACVRFGGMSATLLPGKVGFTAYIGAIG